MKIKSNLFRTFTQGSLKRFFISTLFLLFLPLQSCFAQISTYRNTKETSNISNTSLFNAQFQNVNILFKNYIKIEIGNSNDDQVHLLEIENGEYKEAVTINAVVRNDTLIIEGVVPPTFQFPQDKLSAHKVIDSHLKLLLPKHKNLILSTQEADIVLTGHFKHVFINQLSGSCQISDLQSSIQLVSIYADIYFDNVHHLIDYVSKSKRDRIRLPNDSFLYTALIESVNGSVTIKGNQ